MYKFRKYGCPYVPIKGKNPIMGVPWKVMFSISKYLQFGWELSSHHVYWFCATMKSQPISYLTQCHPQDLNLFQPSSKPMSGGILPLEETSHPHQSYCCNIGYQMSKVTRTSSMESWEPCWSTTVANSAWSWLSDPLQCLSQAKSTKIIRNYRLFLNVICTH